MYEVDRSPSAGIQEEEIRPPRRPFRSTDPAPGWAGRGIRGSACAAVIAVAALFVAIALVPPSAVGVDGAAVSLSAGLGPKPALLCNPNTSPDHSSLLIQIPAPNRNLAPGGSLGYAVELKIANFLSNMTPVNITLPTIFFDFHLATHGNYTLTLPHQNVTINASGWTGPARLSRLDVVPQGLNFTAHSNVRMTSQLLAVMASAAYGAVTLEVRWRWVHVDPNSSVTNYGPWSVPTPNGSWPTQLPSQFYPAPYVSLVGTGNTTVQIGGHFQITIGGAYVAGQPFLEELETGNTGEVIQSHTETAPPNVTSFALSVPITSRTHVMNPGKFLAHVHDGCGALLFSRSLVTFYSASALITFFAPAGCGPITFGGVSFANDSKGSFAPSMTPYNVSAPPCNGKSFTGMALTGGLHGFGPGQVLFSWKGTLTATFS